MVYLMMVVTGFLYGLGFWLASWTINKVLK